MWMNGGNSKRKPEVDERLRITGGSKWMAEVDEWLRMTGGSK